MDLDRAMFDLAANQYGLVARRQLLALGFSPSAIERRRRGGLLVTVTAGVYRVGGAPTVHEQRILAPILASPHLAAASHVTAARLIGFRGFANRTEVHITTGRDRGHQRAGGATVHRSYVFGPADLERVGGIIPITRPERTIIGTAELRPGWAGKLIDEAVLGGRTTVDRLWRYLTRFGGPGCPGSGPVREALEARVPHQRPAESDLERDWIAALAIRGIAGWITQVPVVTDDGVIRIDLGHPTLPVGLEFDSRLWHSSEADYRRERRKRYLLARAGYRIFPVTEFDLHERIGEIAADLHEIVDAAVAAHVAA